MKFTLGWLKDHLETTATLDTIVARLTEIGLEVDSVTDPAQDLAPFTVARVTAAEPHPNADRLKVCVVETVDGTEQVVCGAPNARTGMLGVFAPVGTTIPGTGLLLKAAKIRGVESRGMLVSEREMGMSDEHEGIIELDGDHAIGTPFADVMGLGDAVIDIELTPNRPDCTGIRGIARDLAAAGLGTLKPHAIIDGETVAGAYDSPVKWAIADDGNACPYVVGRHFRGLKNGPSPKWLQDRLRAIGLRPISALVDVTNYVTMDLGRPLHVFDAAKLSGDALTMRRARNGETMLALNGKDYTLDSSMTVIADDAGVHGIGGVMGGEVTGCTETTTEMFLEVALFEPVAIAATGRTLQLESDARYRFERGVDTASADWGAEVAAKLILELCGGETSAVVSAGTRPEPRITYTLRNDRVARLAGVDIPKEEQHHILSDLGFTLEPANGGVIATAPTWRPDIDGEADLVEEIVRIYGIDRVPAVPLERTTPLPLPAYSPAQLRASQVKRALAARGLNEAVTWSFMAADAAGPFGGVPDELRLANPISADLDVMRPSVLPNLISAAGRNLARGLADFGLFEVGPAYSDATAKGQALVAAGVRAGALDAGHWAVAARPVDAFDAKTDALAALAVAGAPMDRLQVTADAPGWYHPGRSGTLRLGANVLAWFGEPHPRALRALDVKGPLAAFEVFLDNVPLPKQRGATRPALDLSPLHPVSRDFAFVVDADTHAEQVLRAARGADKGLIADARVFDVYAGKGIPEGKKSLAIAVTLQPREATLTDAEIDAIAAKVVASVEQKTGGTLRG